MNGLVISTKVFAQKFGSDAAFVVEFDDDEGKTIYKKAVCTKYYWRSSRIFPYKYWCVPIILDKFTCTAALLGLPSRTFCSFFLLGRYFSISQQSESTEPCFGEGSRKLVCKRSQPSYG